MGSLSIVLLSCLLAKGILAATAFSDSNDPIAKVDSFRDLCKSCSYCNFLFLHIPLIDRFTLKCHSFF